MQKVCLGLALLTAWLTEVCAQVSVEITLPQDQFLPSETLLAAVRISNHSGQKVHLGAEADWLAFGVESRKGSVVPKLADPSVVGEFDLDSSTVATKRVDLAPYFNFSEPGSYLVTATVKVRAWDREFTSRAKPFDIIRGAKLWEQEFGVPTSSEVTNATPEVRKYILQQASYLKGQLRLYMRLTDASGARTFRVLPIGQLVSFSRPEGQVDKWSNLHVLYANGAHSFSYTLFNPEGELLVRETYDYVTTRPRLQVNEEGKISVAGGVRRVTAKDVSFTKPAEGGKKLNE